MIKKLLLFIFAAKIAFAAPPGGFEVTKESDNFLPDWNYNYSTNTSNYVHWKPGLRGIPRLMSIAPTPEGALPGLPDSSTSLSFRTQELGTDSFTYIDETVSSYTRSIPMEEKPGMRLWIYLPPFSEWPTDPVITGTYNYMGFRMIAVDEYDREVYSGIFIGRHQTTQEPYFLFRVLEGAQPAFKITQAGWWTLGTSWSDAGTIEFYAAPGRVSLEASNLIGYDTAVFPLHYKGLKGTFLQLAWEPASGAQASMSFVINRVTIYSTPKLPKIEIKPNQLEIISMTVGVSYKLEESVDLANWALSENFVGSAGTKIVNYTTGNNKFYRIRVIQ